MKCSRYSSIIPILVASATIALICVIPVQIEPVALSATGAEVGSEVLTPKEEAALLAVLRTFGVKQMEQEPLALLKQML